MMMILGSASALKQHVGPQCWWTVRTVRMRVEVMGISYSWGGVAVS